MGTLFFSQSNNLVKDENELGSKSCKKNNNFEDENSKRTTKPSAIQIQRRKCQCGTVSFIVFGLLLLTLGLLSIKFTMTDIILTERLKMKPGFPAYEAWLNPKPEIRLNIYIFTVENAEEFANGTDTRMKLKEIGPIVYREYLRNSDVVFHENSTLSYTASRWVEFLPDANEPGILNKTLIVPNFALLAAAGYVNQKSYFLQLGYNIIYKRFGEGLFINVSIYDFLWNYNDEVLVKAREYVPSKVPTVNSGILHGIYSNNVDRYNVKFGTKYGDSEFFHINTVNGVPTVPGYHVEQGDCYASVQNATEGLMYAQRLTKTSKPKFWRKAMCRTVPLHFEKEVEFGRFQTYKYILDEDAFDRLPNEETDCYKGDYTQLPNGLTDVSKCFFDLPIAASKPHFYGRSKGNADRFDGLSPSERHESFTVVEPKMGAPLTQAARSQLNVVIPKLSGIFDKEYQRFSDMILPIIWLEFVQSGLTPDILSMLDFFANILPIIEVVVTSLLLLVGFVLVLVALARVFSSQWNDLKRELRMKLKISERSTM